MPAEPRFLLDENFSHWLGELLPRFGYAVQQVQRIAELGESHPRIPGLRHKASDAEIADWCAKQDWILVTSDQDFRGRELRVRAYLGQGADVILCTRQPGSLREQLELIVFNYPRWLEAVAASRNTRNCAPAPTTGRPQGRPNLKTTVPARYGRGR